MAIESSRVRSNIPIALMLSRSRSSNDRNAVIKVARVLLASTAIAAAQLLKKKEPNSKERKEIRKKGALCLDEKMRKE